MSDGGKRDGKRGVKPDDASFLSRWSRRKVEAKQAPDIETATAKPSTGAVPGEQMPGTPHPERTLPLESEAKQALPAIDTLTHEGDFLPFMAKDVDPGLRNQAMKKLFTDPHYQFAQMDKLDIYIDDYSIENPIPMDILRKMNQAKSLGLFDDEEEQKTDLADPTESVSGIPIEAVSETAALKHVAAPVNAEIDNGPAEAIPPQPKTLDTPVTTGNSKGD